MIEKEALLTMEQAKQVQEYISLNKYDFSLKDLLAEYDKYKKFDYVSNSFKKVFENFSEIFTR